MNQNYYPVDFEAQYEDTSEKMIQIASKFKDRIRNLKPIPLQNLQQQADDLQQRIDQRELQFRKQSIYSQFASGQLMAQRRKQPPQMCPECGQQLKKQAQCEFCAQIYCQKCCSRKRVIPFISKEIRLCCEQCHWKFVKLFDNKAFYQQKQKLANVIHFVKNKVVKLNQKIKSKSEQVQQYKKLKRDQKIKQKAIDSKITQQEKRIRQIEEQLRRVVGEKAERMREEQRRRQRQQQEREKARRAQQERERLEQLQRQREEKQRRLDEERQRRQKQLLEQQNLSASQKKIIMEVQQRELLQTLKRRQEQLRKRQEEIQRKQQQMKRQLEQSESRSVQSSTSIKKADTPKQSIGNNSSQRQKYIDTADSKSVTRSRRESQEIKKLKIQQNMPKPIENLVRTESTKSNNQQIYKSNGKGAKLEEERQREKEKEKIEEEPTDSLERSLVNMFKPKKEDDTKSLMSNVSKTSKSILDMSINQLLAVRIPVSRTSSRIQEERPAPPPPATYAQAPPTVLSSVPEVVSPIEEPSSPNRRTIDRRSVKVEEVDEIKHEEQVRMNKDSILASNSSLMSSTNRHPQTHEEQVSPQKCACEIM